MKTYGRLEWHENPASVRDFRDGDTSPAWALHAVPHVIIKIKRLFPRAQPYRSGWITVKDTTEISRDIEWLLERYPLDMEPDTLARLSRRADEHRATEETVRAILSGDTPSLAGEALLQPQCEKRDYQEIAASLALATGRLLLADDLGLGKSYSALLTLRDPSTRPALVVCYPHLTRQWKKYINHVFPTLSVHIVTTLEPYDPSRRRGMFGHDPDVLIVPWSKLRGWGDSLAGQVKSVIFDEVQELRRTESKKYVAAATVSDQARCRMGLSATPIYNFGGELHNVLSVLAPDALGSRSEFAREWCGGGNWYDKIRIQDPAALSLYLRDQGLMLRRTRKELGRELPEAIPIPHAIDSDQSIFDALTQDTAGLAELIVAKAASREELFRASGEFDWKMRQATGIAKAPFVAEFVKLLLETDEPVVLYGWHRAVYEIWKEHLAEYRPALYTGSESPAQKNAAKERFVNGETPLLMISLRAGAGLDGLQEVSHIAVFGELDWSPGMHDQCIGRLHRDGQDEPVLAYFLVSETGADPVMAEVLNLKRQQSNPILDPNAELFTTAVDTQERIRLLARDVLARRRQRGQ